MSETAMVSHSRKSAALPAVPQEPASIAVMIERLITDPAISFERVNQAMDFYDRVQKERSRQAYLEAKAAFKDNAPQVIRDKENAQYKSTYATIGNVVNTINAELSKHGLDASWDYDQSERIKVTCTLRHVMGHGESVSLSGLPDASGSKNPMQQIKSTLTYLRLATFEAVTGIATKEGALDDDGKAAGDAKDRYISAAEAEEISGLITSTNSDWEKFKEMFDVDQASDLTVEKYARAKVLLKKKAAAK